MPGKPLTTTSERQRSRRLSTPKSRAHALCSDSCDLAVLRGLSLPRDEPSLAFETGGTVAARWRVAAPTDKRETPLMEVSSIGVAIVSPQEIVVAGLRSVIDQCATSMRVVPVQGDAPEPDVVLYDTIGLVSGEGTDLDILVSKTASAVLAIGRHLRPDLASQALNRGADGFFDIGATAAEVCAAIMSTQTGWVRGDAGDNPVTGSVGSASYQEQMGTQQGLTVREREVLALIAQGYSNQEAAAAIYLGVNTINTHIRSAYKKIGATNRAEAVAWAIDHGLPSS